MDANYADVLVSNGPIVLRYFEGKTSLFFNTFANDALCVDEFYLRLEFAKSRGAIHFHDYYNRHPIDCAD